MIILIPTSTPITQVADDGNWDAIRKPAIRAATPLVRTQPQPECGRRRKAMMISRIPSTRNITATSIVNVTTPASGKSSRAMTKRILVIEDQEDLRGVQRDLLSGSGYEMLEAPDGQVGVDKAEAEKPDLILMDIRMLVMDGYDAQNRSGPKSIPIVAVSSFAMMG